jgi:two-component system chemotaxis sensor kinase CheA
VVVQAGQVRYALQVEGLLGQAQVVVKSIERHFRRLPGVMGATILGDGKVALIIDAHGVAGVTGLRDPGDAVRVARSIGSNLS